MSYYLFTNLVVLTFALAVVYSHRTRRVRWLLVSLLLATAPVIYIAGIEVLGEPKPVSKEYFMDDIAEVEVLGYKIVEGDGIYLLLDHKTWDIPRHYFIDWEVSKKMAGKLQEKGDEAKAKGKKLLLEQPFGDKAPGVKHQKPPTGVPNKE